MNRYGAIFEILSLALGSAVLAGCSAATPTASSSASAATSSSVPKSPMEQWSSAYAFLSSQTKPTELGCSFLHSSGGQMEPAPQPAQFYSFSDTARWTDHRITRNDPRPSGTFEECEATVPTTVPYGPKIEDFLNPLGLTFDGANPAPGLKSIEIAYAGQNASDPDIIYRDKPGLFGLEMALQQLGHTPFKGSTSEIIQPATDAAATQYLQYAKPLLDWYGY